MQPWALTGCLATKTITQEAPLRTNQPGTQHPMAMQEGLFTLSKVCTWRRGRGRRERGKATICTTFHTYFTGGRGEKDSHEATVSPFKGRASSSFQWSLCPFPHPEAARISLPGLDYPPACPVLPPWRMWKPLPAAELLHPPLLVSCLSTAHTSDSQTHLMLCGAANRSSRQAAEEETAEQLPSSQSWDTG